MNHERKQQVKSGHIKAAMHRLERVQQAQSQQLALKRRAQRRSFSCCQGGSALLARWFYRAGCKIYKDIVND